MALKVSTQNDFLIMLGFHLVLNQIILKFNFHKWHALTSVPHNLADSLINISRINSPRLSDSCENPTLVLSCLIFFNTSNLVSSRLKTSSIVLSSIITRSCSFQAVLQHRPPVLALVSAVSLVSSLSGFINGSCGNQNKFM